MDQINDPCLVWERLRQGDERAFTEIYEIDGQRVFNHCLRRVLSRVDAEDLTAGVFEIAWRRRAEIRLVVGVGGFPWLLVTANNLMRRHRTSGFRVRRMLWKFTVEEDAEDHAVAITEVAGDLYALKVIARVLDKLSVRDREIVQLCIVEGLSPSVVAIASGEPASSIRSRLSRALARARREYEIELAVVVSGRKGG